MKIKAKKKIVKIDVFAVRDISTYITFTLVPIDNNYKETSVVYEINNVLSKKIAYPTCNSDLYDMNDDASIELIKFNDGYRLENNLQNKYGTYDVIAKLNYGYMWEDGSLDDKFVSCKVIRKYSNITLDGDGATSSSVNSVVASYGELLDDIVIPERKYNVKYIEKLTSYDDTISYQYKFDGYYTGKNGNGDKYIDSNGNGVKEWYGEEDITLYANWEETSLEKPSVTIPTGYNSISWKDGDGSVIDLDKFAPISDVTLYGTIVDSTAPSCTSSVSGTKGDVGWYVSNVSFKYICSDQGSGCVSNNEDVFSGVTLSEEKIHIYENIVVSDSAGNSTTCPKAEIKIDKTAPTYVSHSYDKYYQNNSKGEFLTNKAIGTLSCNNNECSGLTLCVYNKFGTFDIDNFKINITDSVSGAYSVKFSTRNMYNKSGSLTASGGCLKSASDNPCTWKWKYIFEDWAGNKKDFYVSYKVGYIDSGDGSGC